MFLVIYPLGGSKNVNDPSSRLFLLLRFERFCRILSLFWRTDAFPRWRHNFFNNSNSNSSSNNNNNNDNTSVNNNKNNCCNEPKLVSKLRFTWALMSVYESLGTYELTLRVLFGDIYGQNYLWIMTGISASARASACSVQTISTVMMPISDP